MVDKHDPSGSPVELMQYQEHFLGDFFNHIWKKVILLRGDFGLGKSVTLVALCSRLLYEQPTARALVLAPAILGMQFFEMLRVRHTPASLVDRYKFREMLDSATNDAFWPPGVAAVLSVDFAKQPDIRESLVNTHWDLVIADEVHVFKGAREKVLRGVMASAKRVVLATAIGISQSHASLQEDATVVEWRRDRFLNMGDEPFNLVSRPVLNEIPFCLNLPERTLLETLHDLCRSLENKTHASSCFANSLVLRSMSSPAAIEGFLQRHMDQHRADKYKGSAQESTEEAVDETDFEPNLDIFFSEETTRLARRVLQEVEDINFDSKLDAFMALLEQLNRADNRPKRICILTDYMDTLYYLSAEIESQGKPHQILHCGMSLEDRQISLKTSASTGSLLLANITANAEGFDLSDVTHLLLYDIPSSKVEQQQVFGRFDRFGRTTQLHVYAFVSSEKIGNEDAGPLLLLREALTSNLGLNMLID